ncbi:M12 family metallo-peptidase [Nonomuraea sp. NPDC050404]|uniref:PKD domain-containing protein n=1 Tax=Nonomuraea sp. NPDC050404 TaxID=3155783 RepID=UPI0033E17334
MRAAWTRIAAIVVMLCAAVAVFPGTAAAAVTAGCGPGGPFVVEAGTTIPLSFTFTNTDAGDVTFTATMRANVLYGPQHTYLTRTLPGGVGQSVHSHLGTQGLTGWDEVDVTIDITSTATGTAVIGSCTTTLSIIPPLADKDGDALLDVWERLGMDVDKDGEIDLELKTNHRRRDIFLEVDHMTDHKLMPEAKQDVIDAFARAPVANNDGSTGITLHVQEDEEVTHQDDISTWTGYDTIKKANFGTAAERTVPAKLQAKKQVYHYVLMAHQRDSDTSSGRAEIGGNDVLVTLGGNVWAQNAAGTHHVGSRSEQAGTLMHELGHNLGLLHGGDTDVNCKPNYVSVMNYSLQTSLIPEAGGGRRLDYSKEKLDPLHEKELVEKDGIKDGTDFTFWSATGGSPWATGRGDGWLDWDEDKAEDTEKVKVDINNLGIFDCGASPEQTLTGHDDWENLDYNFRDDAEYDDGMHHPTPPELAEPVHEHVDEALAPQVTIGGPYGTKEGTAVTFEATATDPDGDSSKLTYAWDPARTHTYGDDGEYTASVTVTDTSRLSTTATTKVAVENVAPSATIQAATTGRKNVPLDLSGRAADPGSDDLTLTWDWADGTTTGTTHLVNPPAQDPEASPTVQPRDVTDTRRHTWAKPCRYTVKLTATDDDGGSAADTETVLITGDARHRLHTAGWITQYRPGPRTPLDLPAETLACYLDIVQHKSEVFDGPMTRQQAFETLTLGRHLLDAPLLAAWLDFAHGSINPDPAVMARAEAVRQDPDASLTEILRQYKILQTLG